MSNQDNYEYIRQQREDSIELLQGAIDTYLAKGWRIEAQTARAATLIKGKTPNHALHVILTIMTLSFWLPVWLIVVLVTKEKRITVRVTPGGLVKTSKAK